MAYEGENYTRDLSTTDIAKLLRKEIKEIAPNTKWSITSDHLSIHVTLMSAPFEVFMPINEYRTTGHMPVNQYYIENMNLTPEATEMFTKVKEFLWSYNYDNSDIQSDYFDTNFYLHMNIGKWDKPFVLK